MAVEKKILKNRPFLNANGQYNFEDGVNLSIDSSRVNDVQGDLHSITEDNMENTFNVLYPGTTLIGGGNFKISKIETTTRHVSDRLDVRFYLFDNATNHFSTLINNFIDVDSNGFTVFKNGADISAWDSMELELRPESAGMIDHMYEYIASQTQRSRCSSMIARFYTGWAANFYHTNTDGDIAHLDFTTFLPEYWGDPGSSGQCGSGDDCDSQCTTEEWLAALTSGCSKFEPYISTELGSTMPLETFFNFPNFPYVDSDDYYSIYRDKNRNKMITTDGNIKFLGGFTGGTSENYGSQDEEVTCNHTDFYDPTNFDSNTTKINISDFLNSQKNYKDKKSAIYFGVWINSTANGSSGRDETFQLFRIPKYIFYKAWLDGQEKIVQFRGSYTTGDFNAGSGNGDWLNRGIDEGGASSYDPYDGDNEFNDDGETDHTYTFPWPTAFTEGGANDESTSGLYITDVDFIITPPDYSNFFEEESGEILKSLSIIDDNTLIGMNPYNDITYALSGLTGDSPMPNFNPITSVSTVSIDDEFDLQQYYTEEGELYQTSAPAEILLNFDFAKPLSIFDVEYLDIEDPTQWDPLLKLKGFVINWNWKDGDPDDWSEIVESFPKNEPELLLKQTQDNTYNFVNLPDETLTHFYSEPGLKIIKSIVFSYYDYGDIGEGYIQALRWKLVTTKINLNVDSVYIQDFGDIGGSDYTFIPWPETTPVIGGISNESKYINTLEGVVKKNNFREDELLDKTLAMNAVKNDELGDYIGKTDIAQLRYFTSASYDMNHILGIGDEITKNGWNPYNDYVWWDGNSISSSFPQESSVGSIFINDNVDRNLVKNTIIELNMDEIDERTIRDSSGNGYKGILLGDYAIRKDTKDIKVRRETDIKLPEIDDEKKAF